MSVGLARRESRRPGPLKVETAEVSGDIDHFPDEIQTGNFALLHRPRREFVGSDAPRRHLGLLMAFGGGWVIGQA